MVSTQPPSSMQSEQSGSASLAEDFSTTFSPSILMQLIHQYELKAADVVGNYVINEQAVNQLVSTQSFYKVDDELEERIENSESVIRQWPTQLNLSLIHI